MDDDWGVPRILGNPWKSPYTVVIYVITRFAFQRLSPLTVSHWARLRASGARPSLVFQDGPTDSADHWHRYPTIASYVSKPYFDKSCAVMWNSAWTSDLQMVGFSWIFHVPKFHGCLTIWGQLQKSAKIYHVYNLVFPSNLYNLIGISRPTHIMLWAITWTLIKCSDPIFTPLQLSSSEIP